MANYKVVDIDQLESDLTTVADAIREKGGTSESLAFPTGMKNAVEAIKEGTAGTDTSSDKPATANDMTKGKEAFVNGQKVTGNVPECTPGNYDWELLEVDYLGEGLDEDTIELETVASKDAIVRQGAYVGVKLPCSEFGDVSPEEVVFKKTFTSSSGYKKTGTMEALGLDGLVESADGMVVIDENGDGTKELMMGGYTTNTKNCYVEPASGVIVGLKDDRSEMSVFGDASPSDVIAGKTFTSASGLQVTGTHECPEGLDTSSDNPVTASDMLYGKEAFVNGAKVTGRLREFGSNQGQGRCEYSIYFNSTDKTINASLKAPEDRIYRTGASMGTEIPSSTFGDASPEDVLAGKTFTSTSGLKVSGTYVPLDTSDANATASDMVSGKTAYVNGVKVTGEVKETTYIKSTSESVAVTKVDGINYTVHKGYVDSDSLLRKDGYISVLTPYSEFGNATPEDVAEGKVFTSASGYYISGTAKVGSSIEAGDIVKAYQQTNVTIASGYSASCTYGTGVTASEGTLSISGSKTISSSSMSVSGLAVTKGKYIKASSGAIYYIPEDATFTQGGTTYSKTYSVDKCNQMFVYGGE